MRKAVGEGERSERGTRDKPCGEIYTRLISVEKGQVPLDGEAKK